MKELFPQLPKPPSSTANNLLGFIQHSNEDILTNKPKQTTMMKEVVDMCIEIVENSVVEQLFDSGITMIKTDEIGDVGSSGMVIVCCQIIDIDDRVVHEVVEAVEKVGNEGWIRIRFCGDDMD